MKESNLCAFCDNDSTVNGGPYEMNDEYGCGDCYQNAVDRADWQAENAWEEGRV